MKYYSISEFLKPKSIFNAKKKKASLSLSINAIVVLILAITMLGLGLAFMKGTFQKATKGFTKASGEMEKELVNRLKESPDRLTLSVFEVELKRGRSEDAFLAIKNDLAADDTFTITVRCTEMSSSGCGELTVETFPEKDIKSGEVAVLPIKIKSSSGSTPDTYRYDFEVKDSGGDYDETIELYLTIVI